MIVYRDQQRRLETAAALDSLRAPQLEPISLLIGMGEIETGVVDALYREADTDDRVTRALRRASLAAAHVFCGDPWRTRVLAALDAVKSLGLPPGIATGVAEGYAWYGLYPETYIEAARRYARTVRPRRAVVLGVRNIGASLSAVVAATLENLGCRVESFTVRPRGHPYDRRLALAPVFESRLRQLADRHFVVVDEGPGLSGSSLTSVANTLSMLGIPDARIALFPSWNPSGDTFVSEAARERWRRHEKFCASFEETMPPPGTLDVSAGNWRRLLLPDESRWPAVQPQHERRKFLEGDVLLKFAGLGSYGPPRLDRARRLADAGFCPPALGLDNGFLRTAFVPGRPLSVEDVTAELLETIARYLAHLRSNFVSARPVPFEELREMIYVNTGHDVPESLRGLVCDAPTVAIDGRMLPHEWILTGNGYLKTDAVDHHDDHFFPGCQDIAWDIAGTAVEFGIDAAPLAGEYALLAGDRTIARRLPFYLRAYAAWRFGYVTLARAAIAGTDDAARFERLAARYATAVLPSR